MFQRNLDALSKHLQSCYSKLTFFSLFATIFNHFSTLPSQATILVFMKKDLTDFRKQESFDGHFNLRPVEMFKEIHNREPKNLEEALQDPNISNVLENSKKFISKWAITFVKKIVQNLQLP